MPQSYGCIPLRRKDEANVEPEKNTLTWGMRNQTFGNAMEGFPPDSFISRESDAGKQLRGCQCLVRVRQFFAEREDAVVGNRK